jgi:putative membrane protein
VTGPVPGLPGPTDDAAPTAPAPAPVSAPDDDAVEWRRMHPVTPAVKGWKFFAAIVAVVAYNAADDLRSVAGEIGSRMWLYVLLGIVVATVIAFVYSAIAWRMTRFAVTDDAVHLRTGILFRQQRQARLDRLQAVDVVQPLLARILGLAELRLEVAGGSGSAVPLAFLREAEAEQLRAELLARAAGLHRRRPAAADPTTGVAPVDGTAVPTPARAPEEDGSYEGDAPTAPERPVYEVPVGRLFASTLLSGAMVWLVLIVAVVVAAMIAARSVEPVFALLPAGFGIVSYVWSRFNRGANFRAGISADGIRLRHGLTESRAQTVPPGRVQAVRVIQPLMWRGKDWWRVEVNVAGYGTETDSGQAENVLLPVGTRDDALLALWLVLPDLGTTDPRALMDEALTGTASDGSFAVAPRRAAWLDPIGWRRHGVTVTERALVMRSGVLVRSVKVVPHERTQSLGLSQGPVQRRLGLASVDLHSTPGPVVPRVAHLDARVAAGLLDEQATRARTARAAAGPEQWMRRG